MKYFLLLIFCSFFVVCEAQTNKEYLIYTRALQLHVNGKIQERQPIILFNDCIDFPKSIGSHLLRYLESETVKRNMVVYKVRPAFVSKDNLCITVDDYLVVDDSKIEYVSSMVYIFSYNANKKSFQFSKSRKFTY